MQLLVQPVQSCSIRLSHRATRTELRSDSRNNRQLLPPESCRTPSFPEIEEITFVNSLLDRTCRSYATIEIPRPSPYSAWRPTAIHTGEHGSLLVQSKFEAAAAF